MAQRRFHYEQAFEHYLRANGIPYVAVDEAKRALQGRPGSVAGASGEKLKSFDFVVYSASGANLLIDVKGRKHSGRGGRRPTPDQRGLLGRISGATSGGGGGGASGGGGTVRGLQNWVTRDDVSCLQRWSGIFGEGFEPAFAFLYWFDGPPADGLFLEVFAFNDRWYAVLAVRLTDYVPHMRDRSAKWDTVSVPAAAFEAMVQPLKKLL